MHGTADVSLLYPSERLFCERFARKRVAEFTAGRLCARRALGDLGITDFPIAVNPDRSPRWPAGIAGSISHTEGYGCAVVADESSCGSIGVDTEILGRVTPDLDTLLFTVREREFLGSLAVADRAAAATIIFSAKEAFYKCQYAVTHQWLDFQDVSLELNTSDMRNGTFRVEMDYARVRFDHAARLAFERAVIPALWGRFRIDGERVVTGITLRAYR